VQYYFIACCTLIALVAGWMLSRVTRAFLKLLVFLVLQCAVSCPAFSNQPLHLSVALKRPAADGSRLLPWRAFGLWHCRVSRVVSCRPLSAWLVLRRLAVSDRLVVSRLVMSPVHWMSPVIQRLSRWLGWARGWAERVTWWVGARLSRPGVHVCESLWVPGTLPIIFRGLARPWSVLLSLPHCCCCSRELGPSSTRCD